MRVIVWGINYAPEATGIAPHNTALCEFLAIQGHDVEMVTSFCYYPAWTKLPEDRKQWFRTDRIKGVPVHRCWHYVPRKVTSRKRIFHELSFCITTMWRFLTLRAPDLVIVISPPLLLGVCAWAGCIAKRARFVFHVQDLQPDAALGLGMLKPGLFARTLLAMEAFIYRKAWRVSGISDGMLEAFSKKGVEAEKQIYFPNTIELSPVETVLHGDFRRKYGFDENDFLAVHSGNVGVKQGLGVLVEAAKLVKNARVKIVVVGEGAAREVLAETIRKEQLVNIILLPLLPADDYQKMLIDADLGLVTQQRGAGRSFFPSKLLNLLAHGKPVFAVADEESELSRVIAEGKFGTRISPDDPAGLAAELDRLANAPDELANAGAAGRKYVERFDRERVFREFAQAVSL